MKLYVQRKQVYNWHTGRNRAGSQVEMDTSKRGLVAYGGDVRCCVKGFKRAFGFTPRVGKVYRIEGEVRVEEV